MRAPRAKAIKPRETPSIEIDVPTPRGFSTRCYPLQSKVGTGRGARKEHDSPGLGNLFLVRLPTLVQVSADVERIHRVEAVAELWSHIQNLPKA